MPQISGQAASFLVAILTGRVRLEFDYGTTRLRDAFAQQYREVSGEDPVQNPSSYRRSNKWGRQYRIYLSLDGPQRHFVQHALGITLTPVAVQHAHRSYNYRFTPPAAAPQLFWDLVALGFRLGDN